MQEGPSSFAIFDTFDDEAGREAHLKGKVAAALMEKAEAGDLFAKTPEIHKLGVLADKVFAIDHSSPGLHLSSQTMGLKGSNLVAGCFGLTSDRGRTRRSDWTRVGSSIIVVDTLGHNFLRRTGIARAYGLEHGCGTRCHGPDGCEAIITDLAQRYDARSSHPDYPKTFPRLAQLGIWDLCAERRDNICNGRQIDDSKPCG
jgi:hypothetical protein